MEENYIPKEIDKNYIPKEILDKAVALCNENFWTYLDALRVVEVLSVRSCAIVGVELHEQVDDSPKWIATSNYNHDENVPWIKYVELCNNSAKDFIELNKEYKSGLFNFTYIQEGEIKQKF